MIKKKHAFKFVFTNAEVKKELVLAANSEEEKLEWIHALGVFSHEINEKKKSLCRNYLNEQRIKVKLEQ